MVHVAKYQYLFCTLCHQDQGTFGRNRSRYSGAMKMAISRKNDYGETVAEELCRLEKVVSVLETLRIGLES